MSNSLKASPEFIPDHTILPFTIYRVLKRILKWCFIPGFIALLFLMSCAGIQQLERGISPLIRIGLLEDKRTVPLKLNGHIEIRNDHNQLLYEGHCSGAWFVTVSQEKPGRAICFSDVQNTFTLTSSRILCITGSVIELPEVEVGKNYHWEGIQSRSYKGVIEFVKTSDSTFTVVNVVSVEEYLKGVVPSEMPPGFPPEALKAQAVASRSYLLSRLGSVHTNSPFDVCDDVHCQVYSGITRETPSTNTAVDQTRGLVLKYHNEICRATYASVCGGHTEDADNVWQWHDKPYLVGILDYQHQLNGFFDLGKEDNVRIWLESSPIVFCNTLTGNLPPAFEYTKKYFRWQVEYSMTELKSIIEQKTQQTAGEITDIIPVKRGVSGRITELQIIGTIRILDIKGELEIRKALSATALYSSCFILDWVHNTDDTLQKVIIKGAGWGHGAGMCQTGAGIMALQGYSFDQILHHYYTNTKLERVY